MEQTPEIGPIEISYTYPDLKLELTLKADHPRINHATDDERESLKSVLAGLTSEALRILNGKTDLELLGKSVLDELFYMESLMEVMQGRMQNVRISAEAKRADERMAARKQNLPQQL